MGWIERCYQTYEKNLAQVGKPSASIRHGWNAPILLPVAHTTQKVNVEVHLSEKGDFLSCVAFIRANTYLCLWINIKRKYNMCVYVNRKF